MRLPGSAGRSGGRMATPEGVVSMPPMLRPRAGTRDAATGRGLGISAPRAARDLTGEPCSIPRRAVRGAEFSARESAWFGSKDGSGREWGGGKPFFLRKKD